MPALAVNFASEIFASVGAFRTVHMIKSFSGKYPSAFRDFLQNVGKTCFAELSTGILGSRLTTLRSKRGHRSPLGTGSICPRPSEDPPNGSNHSLNVLPGKLSLSQYRSALRLLCGLDFKFSSFQTRRHDVSDSLIAAREGSAASQECVRFESRAALRDSDCERRNRAWRSNQTFFAGLASASLSFARWASISSVVAQPIMWKQTIS